MSTESLKDSFKSFLVDINAKEELPIKSDYSGPTFLFHDYESWGINTRFDFPNQFAAIRTDLDLNIIEKPVSFYSQIPNDYVPHPMACLVTGITPQKTLRDGLNEADFAKRIITLMSQADTCVVGYNSIRFDDELTRHMLYRNFYDPYEREWKNGNSRWDVIDLVRACYALRPEGIKWPKRDDGSPSFKLEELTVANGIAHENAHDAISDVKATIAMAKLIKEKQPKLFEFYFGLRNKNTVLQHIDLDKQSPFLHVSGMISASQGCCSWFMPVCMHPSNKNAVICIDLSDDVTSILSLDASDIKKWLYTPSSELPEGVSRPPVKLVHINKCPFVAPAKTLSPEHAEHLGIDRESCLERLQALRATAGLGAKLSDIYVNEDGNAVGGDIDGALYTRGFPSVADKEWKTKVVMSEPEQLVALQSSAPDEHFAEQLFRYRARNYPATLDENELKRWQQHRKHRFTEESKTPCLSVSECQIELTELSERYAEDNKKLAILSAISRYLEEL